MAIASNLDIQRLEHLYKSGFCDTFLDNALRKVIERQIARDGADLARVNEALARFEQQYNMSPEEFWRSFQTGQMPDSADLTSFARCSNALSPVCKSYGAAMGQHY